MSGSCSQDTSTSNTVKPQVSRRRKFFGHPERICGTAPEIEFPAAPKAVGEAVTTAAAAKDSRVGRFAIFKSRVELRFFGIGLLQLCARRMDMTNLRGHGGRTLAKPERNQELPAE